MDSKLEDKRFCIEWQQACPDFSLLLIFSWIECWFVKVVANYLNCSVLSKELLPMFTLWRQPAFWSRHVTMCLVLSAVSSRPVSLLATTKASVFLFIVCTLPPNILTSSAWIKSCCLPFNLKPSWFTWTLLMAYSKAKLKSNGDRAPPCFKSFLINKTKLIHIMPLWRNFAVNKIVVSSM